MPMGSLARRPTVLIVLHQEHSSPGRVGAALKAMGARLDIRRPSCGEPLPATLADHSGVVVFGGPMGANDTLEWVRREIDWLGTPLAEDKPLLGLWLGAQMLAALCSTGRAELDNASMGLLFEELSGIKR